ncbi:hypothetical protein [Phyllobacterium sp. SB3]|uniref:hypothetical protein n=1 Tax=Phyllobacterium sp. SB3 TaxID=3156073 RepID=UPI0032AFB590
MTKITSLYDGEHREFEIKREFVPYIEQSLGRSLYAVLKDFTNGHWTYPDVAQVISFALKGPSVTDRQTIGYARQAAKFGFAHPPFHYKPHPDVIAVLERDGHGNFADLAAEILTIAVFGDKESVDGEA